MKVDLKRHPDSPCMAVTQIEAHAARSDAGVLSLEYCVRAEPAALLLPRPTEPRRTDELWRHTCLEAFVHSPADETYYEFNFAPSTQWAAYRFDGYRQGMAPADIEPPGVVMHPADDGFTLCISLNLGRAHDLPPTAVWRLGLAAVIEEVGGRISYWAAAHPPGRPDFHHADGFALDLTPTEQS
ncbi:MAG: DOMON-like domain-containing protein [Phenylobacterium sp.]|uniref:DOMON-like domain-containing protein n=1 Tax=Phenylobacterium sp. TaxID=1871053 RepID=UPI00273631B7|nr:DOMON-like domain-containing protein [Phenylobacterium sp.]MDP3173075.1 DOMON-like domain-containing protein [Phenylobacterium sp.]